MARKAQMVKLDKQRKLVAKYAARRTPINAVRQDPRASRLALQGDVPGVIKSSS